MTAIVLKNLEWYASMLEPLDNEMKISIIKRLAASMLSKDAAADSFADLSSAWKDDGLTPEEEASNIRSARKTGQTRTIEEW